MFTFKKKTKAKTASQATPPIAETGLGVRGAIAWERPTAMTRTAGLAEESVVDEQREEENSLLLPEAALVAPPQVIRYERYRNTPELVRVFSQAQGDEVKRKELLSVMEEMVTEFGKSARKQIQINEMIALAACSDEALANKLFNGFLMPLKGDPLLSIPLLMGLSQMIGIAPKKNLIDADLIDILRLLIKRLSDRHQSLKGSKENNELLKAIALTLDAMVDQGVKDVSQEKVWTPASQVIKPMQEIKSKELTVELLTQSYWAAYAFEGLRRTPDNVSKEMAALRKGLLVLEIFGSVASLVASHGTDLSALFKIIDNVQGVMSSVSTIVDGVKSAAEAFASLDLRSAYETGKEVVGQIKDMGAQLQDMKAVEDQYESLQAGLEKFSKILPAKGKVSWYRAVRSAQDMLGLFGTRAQPDPEEFKAFLTKLDKEVLRCTNDTRNTLYGILHGILVLLAKTPSAEVQSQSLEFIKHQMMYPAKDIGKKVQRVLWEGVFASLLELIAKGEASLSVQVRKQLLWLEAQLLEKPKSKEKEKRNTWLQVTLQKTLCEYGVDQVANIKAEGKPVFQKIYEETLLTQAKRRSLALDYRVDLMMENADKLRDPQQPLAQDLKMYVPLQGKISEHATDHFSLLSKTHQFLDSESKGWSLCLMPATAETVIERNKIYLALSPNKAAIVYTLIDPMGKIVKTDNTLTVTDLLKLAGKIKEPLVLKEIAPLLPQIINITSKRGHTIGTKKVLLIQGSAGGGKSLFLRFLETELWQGYVPGQAIPLFISLPSLADPTRNAVEQVLAQFGCTLDEIARFQREREFVFIMDGFDEIKTSHNIYHSNQLSKWNAKIIITSRSEYLAGKENYRSLFKVNKALGVDDLAELYIVPFEKSQVDTYLKNIAEGYSLCLMSPDTLVEKKTIYLKLSEDKASLVYTLITPTGQTIETGNEITVNDLPELAGKIKAPLVLEELKALLPNILSVTLKRGHTSAQQRDSAWNWQHYRAILDRISGLNELVSTPFVLSIITQVLPQLEEHKRQEAFGGVVRRVTRADVYAVFVNYWFEHAELRVRGSGVSIPEEFDLKTSFAAYCTDLSFRFFLCNKTAVQTQTENYRVQKLKEDEWSRFFKGKDEDRKTYLAREGALLRKTGNQVSFIHKSILEYFVAVLLYQEILEHAEEILDKNSFLNQKLLTSEPSMLRFLIDLTQEKYQETQILLKIVESTRGNSQLGIAGANAITLLNQLRFCFSGIDLRGIHIAGADLENALMHKTNLQGADLRGVNLRSAYLIGADLTQARLKDLRFAEYPHLKVNKSIAYVCYSPDGAFLAIASGDEIQLWDTKTGQPLGEPLQGHTDAVTGVTFSPDGLCLASASLDKTVRLWDPKTGRPLGEPLQGHTDAVYSVAFSPDGLCLASGSSDHTVRLWDPKTGRPLGEPLQGHTARILSVAFSPDGLCLASGSRDNTIRLWDPKFGRSLGEPCQGHTDGIFSVAFSPDGLYLASGSFDKTVRLWDPKTGRPLGKPLQGHTDAVSSVAFSPDGLCLASGSGDTAVRLWNPKSGQSLGEPLQGHNRHIRSIAFSPDGLCLASGSSDNTVRFWDTTADKSLSELLQGHTHHVRSIAFSPDGLCLVSGSLDNTIRLWDPKTGRPLSKPLQGHTDYVNSVAFSPDGLCLASGSRDHTVRLWDLKSGQALGEPLRGHTDEIWSVAFSPDGLYLASGSFDKTVRLWDPKTGRPLGTPLQGHTHYIFSVAFSPDGLCLASGSNDKTIRLWDPKTGRPLGKPLQGHTAAVSSVAFSPDGLYLASGSGDNTVRLWDPKTGRSLGKPLQGHIHPIWSVTFSRDGFCLVSGSDDETIRLWDCKDLNHIQTLGTPIRFNGKPIPFYSKEGTLSVVERQGPVIRICKSHRLSNGQIEWLVQAKTPPAYSLQVADAILSGSTGLSNSNYRLLMQRKAVDATPQLHTDPDGASDDVVPAADGAQEARQAVALPKAVSVNVSSSMAQLLSQEQEKLFRGMVDSQQKLLEKFERLEASQARIEAEMKASRGQSKPAPS